MLARTHGMTATWLAIAALIVAAIFTSPATAVAQDATLSDATTALVDHAHTVETASDASLDASLDARDEDATPRADSALDARAQGDGRSLAHDDGATDGAAALVAHALDDGGAHEDGGSIERPHGGSTPSPAARVPAAQVARVALGLIALLALAMIAAHPRVRAFEKKAGVGMFATAALPFIALGAIARNPAVGVLTPSVVNDLKPALDFGLGWIGFRIGAEFDVRGFDRLPKGTGVFVLTTTLLPLLATGAATMLILVPFHWPLSPTLLRDALLIGACAAVSAPTGARALERAGAISGESSRLLRAVMRMDDAVPIVVLAIVTALFRSAGRERFTLPPLGWVFLQVGMGACLGFLLLAARASAKSDNERAALTFGGVAFSAGMAQYLGFSPLVVTFCAGVIVASLRDAEEDDFTQLVLRLERPIYLTFFALVGATWSVARAEVLLLLGAYIIARTTAKLVAPTVRTFPGAPPASRVAIALQPSSVVAVAVVVTARNLYPDFSPLYESVVLFGALFAEVFTQVSVAIRKRREPPPPELEIVDDEQDEEVLL